MADPKKNGKPSGVRDRSRTEKGLPKGSTVVHPDTASKKRAAKAAESKTPSGRSKALQAEIAAHIREMHAKKKSGKLKTIYSRDPKEHELKRTSGAFKSRSRLAGKPKSAQRGHAPREKE
jgi:hypothetical protein